GEHLGLGEQERQHGHPLLTLRTVRAEVAVAGEDAYLVEVRPRTCVAAREIPRQALVERRAGRRLSVVPERCRREPELARALGKGRRNERETQTPRLAALRRARAH